MLSLIGRLDSSNTHTFESILMGHIETGERRVVVEFSRLNFISSSGLRVCLIAAKALRAGDGTLVLCAMNEGISEVFQITGFSRIISIKDTLEAALGSA